MTSTTRTLAAILALTAALVANRSPAVALETDQFFAWGHPLEDSTDVLNARVNIELERVIARLNERPRPAAIDCDEVRSRFYRRFRMLFFNGLEVWAGNSPLVSRYPSTSEEFRNFRRSYLYHATSIFDTGIWMPASPTVLVNGVRIGTDKLTHFMGTSWYYHRWYRTARRRGESHQEAVQRTLRRGLKVELTILGHAASGILSPGDLEANYHGMTFYNDLCAGPDPTLVVADGLWRLRRPFDLRDYVTPEWDESYQPPSFTRSRWRKVLPVIRQYCPMLANPRIQAMRRAYAERDETTPTEILLREMIEQQRIKDPADFSIERACATGEGP